MPEQAEVIEVAGGLWVWRLAHPDWTSDSNWEPPVASTCVESGSEVVLLDPLAPPDGDPVWDRLDAKPPRIDDSLGPMLQLLRPPERLSGEEKRR